MNDLYFMLLKIPVYLCVCYLVKWENISWPNLLIYCEFDLVWFSGMFCRNLIPAPGNQLIMPVCVYISYPHDNHRGHSHQSPNHYSRIIIVIIIDIECYSLPVVSKSTPLLYLHALSSLCATKIVTIYYAL